MRSRIAILGAAFALAITTSVFNVGPASIQTGSAVAFAAVARTFTDTNISLVAGQQYYPNAAGREIGALVQRQGYNHEEFTLDLSNIPETDTVQIALEFSNDNFATIIPGGAVTTTGGPNHGKRGTPGPLTFNATLPNIDQGAALEERINITVPEAELIPTGTITFSTV